MIETNHHPKSMNVSIPLTEKIRERFIGFKAFDDHRNFHQSIPDADIELGLNNFNKNVPLGPFEAPELHCIHLSNLDVRITNGILRKIFQQFGGIRKVTIEGDINSKAKGNCALTGCVYFDYPISAARARTFSKRTDIWFNSKKIVFESSEQLKLHRTKNKQSEETDGDACQLLSILSRRRRRRTRDQPQTNFPIGSYNKNSAKKIKRANSMPIHLKTRFLANAVYSSSKFEFLFGRADRNVSKLLSELGSRPELNSKFVFGGFELATTTRLLNKVRFNHEENNLVKHRILDW